MYGEAIRSGHSGGKRIAVVSNYQADTPILRNFSLIIQSDGLLEWGDGGYELYSKNHCFFSVAGEGFGGKGDGLMGRGSALLPLTDLIMLHRRKILHLWEHDSTIWVHFFLLESAMLWQICVSISCMCVSMGEEERRVSRSTTSHLVISVRVGIMLGMWYFAEEFRILWNLRSPTL